ncbi:MAG: M61 family metallopeptidase [Pyrinomonadaceae bacterium]|nr:M61 family metallopeptidase [Pyrinomonadaceae bacterium]
MQSAGKKLVRDNLQGKEQYNGMASYKHFMQVVQCGVIAAFLTLWLATTAAAVTRIENVVTIPNPKQPILQISTTITGVKQEHLTLGVPNWTPGYYTTEDFSRNIRRLTFTDQSGRPLRHRKPHDSMWTIDTRGASVVRVNFDYMAGQLDLNKSQVTPTYAILNGTNFFLYIKEHTLDTPATVTFKLPPGWSIASGLGATADPTTFAAENYDVLVDCPMLVGEFDLVTLSLRGVPHKLAVTPKGVMAESDLKKLADNYLKVIDVHNQMFGEIPYKSYLTINVFDESPLVSGGLEHANSYLGILPKQAATSAAFEGLTSLTSHEFFHAYNVKRIRPAEMWPYRYDQRNYTPLLWFSEGVTDYYTTRGMLRAGLTNREEYLQGIVQTIIQVQAAEAAHYISLEDASVNTWLGGAGGQGQPFTIDYYSRGNIIGLLLDLSIRHDTNGVRTLDDVMRTLYQNYYKHKRGFTSTDLIAEINRLTKSNYQSFFDKFVGDTASLPFKETLAFVGLQFAEVKSRVPRLGIASGLDGRIGAVLPDGAAAAAGVREADVLVSVGQITVSNPEWASEFRQMFANKEGQLVSLKLLREGKPVQLNMPVKLVEEAEWKLQPLPRATAHQKELLSQWLAGK